MKQSKIISFCVFFMVMLTFNCCIQNSRVRYGLKFNNEREKIGLLKINPQWQPDYKWKDRILWNPINIDSIKKTGKAFYGEKRLQFKNDTLIFEADEFVGPNSFIGKGKLVRLSCNYYFVPYEMRSVGWEYSIIRQIGEDELGKIVCSSEYITKNEADSILNSWGLKCQ